MSARIPEEMPLTDMEAVVGRKEYLIHKHLAEWSLANENKVNRSYVNGPSFLCLGKNYRLKIEDIANEGILLKNGYFIILKKEIGRADDHFKSFYKNKLSQN